MAVTPGLTLMNASPISRQSPRVLEAGLSEAQPGYPALKNVPEELKGIESLYGGRTLLNQDLKVDRLREELSAHQYTIVHIASHAEFVTNSHLAFLLAYDKKISLDDLQNLVSTSRFHEQPLELLTLCACQTAAGDDRAELGLAGVAIKAGARSALATLWVVNDDSSKLLIAGFYKNLRDNPGMSKARALQLAQLSLWKEDSYKHPEVWAPYLMIGNWL